MTEPKKETRGGPGRGQGRRQKYGVPTVTIALRVPESKEQEVREVVERHLEQYLKHPD
jgi:hypothetical protein